MKKKLILIFGSILALAAIALFSTKSPKPPEVLGTTTFNSSQVGGSAANGFILQTDGTVSTWVAASTLSTGGLTNYDAFTHVVSGTSATTTEMRFNSGFISTASSTLMGPITVGSLTATSSLISDTFQALNSTGITFKNSSGNTAASIGVGPGTGLTVNGSASIGQSSAETVTIAGGAVGNPITFTGNSSSPDASFNFIPKGNGVFGIGTTTASTTLSVQGSGLFSNNITIEGLTLLRGNLNASSTASSTFAGGINVGTIGGLSSASGLTISGGNILQTNSATNTFAGGLISNGLSQFKGFLSTASSTFSSGLNVSGGLSVAGTFTLDTALTVPNGGTGAATFTSNGVLFGNTTSAIQATVAGEANSILASVGSAPFFTRGATTTNFYTLGTTTIAQLSVTGKAQALVATSTFGYGLLGAYWGGGVGIGTSTVNGLFVIDGARGEVHISETNPTFSATPTINWNNGNKQIITMTANITAITMTGGNAGGTYRLELCQDTTGNRTVVGWGANTLFYTGDLSNATSSPGITTKPSTCNIFTFDASFGTSTLIYQGTLPLKGY